MRYAAHVENDKIVLDTEVPRKQREAVVAKFETMLRKHQTMSAGTDVYVLETRAPEAVANAKQSFEEGLKEGIAPSIVTDSTFMSGWYSGDQFEKSPVIGEAYRSRAKAFGVNPKGKRYLHQLAEFAGDPRAWVESRGDVQRLCEERGYNCDGMVKVKSPTKEYVDKGEYVADDIIDNYVADQIEAVGDDFVPTEQQINDMKDAARDKLTPNYKANAEPID